MQLNCKVIKNKKVATPHFYINPTFSGLSPLSRKFLVPPLPQVTQFLEGPWVGSNYESLLLFLSFLYFENNWNSEYSEIIYKTKKW